MAVRMTKPWRPLTASVALAAGGYLGVYELQAPDGQTVFIGCAGGRSLFGLRGELERELGARGAGHQVRYEVSTQYLTRMQELLMAHVADHGELPRDNQGMSLQLGRLHPA
jgi:hypothetical protein